MIQQAPWYFTRLGQREGPVSEGELRSMLLAGKLSCNDLAWRVGFDNWLPIGEIDGLGSPPPVETQPPATVTTVDQPPPLPGNQVQAQPDLSDRAIVRPWRRWLARMLDYYLAAFLFGTLVTVFDPRSPLLDASAAWLNFLVILGWTPLEGLLLSTTGNTPGKALLNIRVHDPNGQKLSLEAAMARCARVWWFGLGAGVPIVTLFTLAVGHATLTRDKQTSWDRKLHLSVEHRPIGADRGVLLAIIVSLLIYFTVLGVSA